MKLQIHNIYRTYTLIIQNQVRQTS